MLVTPLGDPDRERAAFLVREHFASSIVVSRGRAHDTAKLPGLVAVDNGELVGVLHYDVRDASCEVVTLIATRVREGIATALIGTLSTLAAAAGCERLWLVTANDNVAAQAFYTSVGFRLVAVHHGAVAQARSLKPEIPLHSDDGTAIEDELEFEFPLGPA